MEEQSQKKQIETWLPNSLLIFLEELFLFSLTLAFGIFLAFRINNQLPKIEVSVEKISFLQFISYFFLGTLFIVILSYFKKFQRQKAFIYKSLFVITTFSSGLITLDILGISNILGLVFMSILIFFWLKAPSALNHNALIILGISSIGSILGLSLSPMTVAFILIIFSIYDFIAVYKTKHMIKMAKDMIESGSILALVLPQKTDDFKAPLNSITTAGKSIILGGGDIAFPLIMASSLVPEGFLKVLIVSIFAVLGFSTSFLIFASGKERRSIPALPPIALGSILGFLITRFF